MKSSKFSLIGAIAFVIAAGAGLAFKSSQQNLVWFPMEDPAAGTIDVDNPYPGTPTDCSAGPDHCAVAFEEEDLINGEAPISDADEDPQGLIKSETFQDLQQ